MLIKIILALLLLPQIAFASGLTLSGGTFSGCGSGAGLSGCDSCSGALILTSHFENTDNIETGTPCGCSTNADKTWALTGATYSDAQKSDGTYSLYIAGSTQNAIITADPNKSAGTITFDIYVAAWRNVGDILVIAVDADNYIAFYTYTTSGVGRLDYQGNNVSKVINVTGLTENAWHTITLKWSTTAVGGKYLYAQVDAETAVTGAEALTEIVGTPTTVKFGYGAITPATYYIDNVKLYNAWQ